MLIIRKIPNYSQIIVTSVSKNHLILPTMLSKEERKELNSQFWESFRKEMRNRKSSNGRGINWINYPSDVKDVYVRLQVEPNSARLCFDIQPKDDDIRSILWEQMTELKKVMENEVGEATAWNEFDHEHNGRKISRIFWEKTGLNFYNPNDHKEIKDFLQEKLVKFDIFYQEYKEILISLAE